MEFYYRKVHFYNYIGSWDYLKTKIGIKATKNNIFIQNFIHVLKILEDYYWVSIPREWISGTVNESRVGEHIAGYVASDPGVRVDVPEEPECTCVVCYSEYQDEDDNFLHLK